MLILLIEDDEDFGSALTEALREKGYDVDWRKSGDEGLYRASEWEHDLVVLDRMLPGMDGIEVLRNLRARKTVPVLMLTALNSPADRVEGLDSGADDYLGKPFELPEFFARIRALSRRLKTPENTPPSSGELRLEPHTRQVFFGDQEVPLTPTEYRVVEMLLLRRGRLVSRQILEDRLAGGGAERGENVLDVVIHRVRQKLGRETIRTRRGLGYLIEAFDRTG